MQLFHRSAILASVMIFFAGWATAQETPRVKSDLTDYEFEATEPLLDAFDRFELTEVFALNARKDAADLKSFIREPELYSWRSHAAQLSRIRTEANEIADHVDRLNQLTEFLLPRQELALEHIEVDAAVMVANIERAIEFVNEQQGRRWDDRYETYVSEVYERADAIAQAAHMSESRLNVEEYLKSSD